MFRLFTALLFVTTLLMTPHRAQAHAADEDSSISITCEVKPGKLEQTVNIPVWFLVNELYGEKTTLLSLVGKDADIRAKVVAWMREKNPVIVDGAPASPEVRTMEARSSALPELQPFPAFVKDFADFDDTMLKHMAGVKIDLVYRMPADPKVIAFRWTRHIVRTAVEGEPTMPVPPVFLAVFNEDKHRFGELTPNEPEWVWRSDAVVKAPESARLSSKWEPKKWHLPVAAPTLGLGALLIATLASRPGRRVRTAVIAASLTFVASGAQWVSGYGCVTIDSPFQKPPPRPAPAEAKVMFSDLLHGVYKAFDYNKDSDIYDALSRCVDGPLLEQIYRDVHGSLVLDESEGGAICHVEKVEIKKTDPLPAIPGDSPDTLRLDCAWTVRGKVSHWNHTHTRANAYEAEYTLAPCADNDGPRWKITGCKVKTQKPVEVTP